MTAQNPSTSSIHPANFNAETYPLKILLAEDNAVSQKVTLHILKRLGYEADVVENGLEVLQALRYQVYDFILMDVQMPEMDGLEATRRIRQTEIYHRLWIVAMTANTQKDDCEECLAAGMNDYVNKPIHLEQLRQALNKCQLWLAANPQPKDSLEKPIANLEASIETQAESVIDLTSLQHMFGEVTDEVIIELIDCYLEDSPKLLAAIADAIAQQDADALCQNAHSFKSSSASFGATKLVNLCQELETRGRTGTLTGNEEKLDALKAQYERVKLALQREHQQNSLKPFH